MACVLIAAGLWGTTGTAAALAPEVGPLAIGAAAMGFGGLLQAVVAGRSLIAHRTQLLVHRRVLGMSALAVAIYPLAFYSSMHLAGVAIGTVVSIGSAPAAAAIIERIIDHRPLTRRWFLGSTVGVAGVIALAVGAPGVSHGVAGRGSDPLLGIALGLVAGLTYALYSWGAGRVMARGVSSRPVMGATFGVGGLLLLPVLLITGEPILDSPQNAAVAAYLAVVPMCLGYLLYGRALASIPASTATTLSLLEPAVAALIAGLVLGELLTAAGWCGVALVFASLVITAAPRRAESVAVDPASDSSEGSETRLRLGAR